MNLRNIEKYNVGLDIGTGSVGWAVTDDEGNLCHFKSKPTWGSRLFPSAETAAVARMPRGQRRRYIRRRQRLDLLQTFFMDEIASCDPDFFIRLKQSRLWPEDRAEGRTPYRWPLFNDSDFNEAVYYSRFPTIYHLREWLMTTDEKSDIRLIYLALHNIVKHRGNFLHEDNKTLSAKNADMKASVEVFCRMLEDWCDEYNVECTCVQEDIVAVFEDMSLYTRAKQERLASLFGLDPEYKKTLGKELSKALVGYKANFGNIFFDAEMPDSSFRLSDDEKVDSFLQVCPDMGVALFEAIQAVYSSYVLMGILKNADGGTLSSCKINEYVQYGKDLEVLKKLVRQYASDKYESFFRGEFYPDTKEYDPSKAMGYTKYNLGTQKMSYDDFKKEVVKLFKDTDAPEDKRHAQMMQSFDEETFLRRLKTSDNGSIPFQLHLEEMDAIIENQGKYYPFLLENKSKIESLVTFRIPYYVGPLTLKNAPKGADGKYRFAWAERKPGMENEKITPWNWEDVIDKQKSAQAFIERMVGECTYLQGEQVLPRCSLLYEEYCLLNELNGAKWTQDGDKYHRFDYQDRCDIINELFRSKRVTYKQAADWMKSRNHSGVRVSGGQGETGFESKLSSYIFFCKDVYGGIDELPEADIPMIEEIILWNTLFEDRSILREEIKRVYGDSLSDDQIKIICKKRFAGWGRLSQKFLTGLKAQTDNGPKSLMDILREGDQNNVHLGRAMNLMEILHDDNLGFQALADEHNAQLFKQCGGLSINELPGSPALRRSINQSLRIVEEIVGIAGKSPRNIYIEVTREENARKKGRRTTRRYDNLKEALRSLKNENPSIWKEINGIDASQLDERLTLYFMQNGKSLYSGKTLDIRYLSDYQVDHIIPQSYIKDDSFENKALVLSGENQAKSDALLLDSSIRQKMKGEWKALHNAGLIGEKKYNNLMRSSIKEDRLKGFIARQLVETSQIVKTVQQMLSASYPEVVVVPIKASLSSQLRDAYGLVKCREVNDYHHAHDAYLACEVGRFVQKRHPVVFENPIALASVVKQFVKKQSEGVRKGRMPGSASFIIQSFMKPGFDVETGELFKDDWNPTAEVARIKRFMNYHDCFISRMPEETAGAFWDATIYSPKGDKKALKLPLKRGLDPEKYGSFSREQYAFFFVYKAQDKKKRPVFQLAPVPVRVAAAISGTPDELERYATELAQTEGLEFVSIVRAKVYKYQQIELGGDRLYITGKNEVRNAREFAFGQDETGLIKALAEGSESSADERLDLLRAIVAKYETFAPRLGNAVKAQAVEPKFLQADPETQRKVLLSLVQIAAAKTNMIDLRGAGGRENAGCMRPTFSRELASGQFVFIDQSVTGMFERRQRIGL